MKTKASKTEPSADLELAFDVGHSSLGWAVLKIVLGLAFCRRVGCRPVPR